MSFQNPNVQPPPQPTKGERLETFLCVSPNLFDSRAGPLLGWTGINAIAIHYPSIILKNFPRQAGLTLIRSSFVFYQILFRFPPLPLPFSFKSKTINPRYCTTHTGGCLSYFFWRLEFLPVHYNTAIATLHRTISYSIASKEDKPGLRANMTVNVFSVPVFFVVFRESLETVVIVSVLLAFIKQSLGDSDKDATLRKVLFRQVRRYHDALHIAAKPPSGHMGSTIRPACLLDHWWWFDRGILWDR